MKVKITIITGTGKRPDWMFKKVPKQMVKIPTRPIMSVGEWIDGIFITESL